MADHLGGRDQITLKQPQSIYGRVNHAEAGPKAKSATDRTNVEVLDWSLPFLKVGCLTFIFVVLRLDLMANPCQAGALPLSHTQRSSVQFKAHHRVALYAAAQQNIQ